MGNTEWLARQGATVLPEGTRTTWMHLAALQLPPFVDQRHTVGHYAPPEGDLKQLLDATLAATDVVLVAPVYWFSLPTPIKQYLDHWSAFLRVPGLPLLSPWRARRCGWSAPRRRTKAQPCSTQCSCARSLGMG
jgi:NAD(P)H-dependent FMN reductase